MLSKIDFDANTFAIGAAIATATLATIAAAFMAPTDQRQRRSTVRPRLQPRIVQPDDAARCEIIPLPKAARKARSKPAAVTSEYAPFADYQIKRYRTERVGPTCVVAWSDNETTRMSVATLPGKPFNIGRALRVSLAAWQSRRKVDRLRIKPAPASVLTCHFEREGEVIAKFNPAECNAALNLTAPYAIAA